MRPLSSARLIAVLLLLAGNALGQSTYQNSSLPPAQRAADLVAHMTLQEKAAQSINSAAGHCATAVTSRAFATCDPRLQSV